MNNHRDAEAQRDLLTERVIGAAIEVPLPVQYKGVHLDCGYRMDIVVEHSLIVELKTVQSIEAVHEAQLLSYMRLARMRKGLILNFYVPVLKQGIKRMVL